MSLRVPPILSFSLVILVQALFLIYVLRVVGSSRKRAAVRRVHLRTDHPDSGDRSHRDDWFPSGAGDLTL